jgi:broad specificity phosphatase PhoE
MKMILLPEVQEVSNLPCDTGSPREVLAEEFGDAVDLSLLSSENWPDKSRDTPFAPVMDKLEARAQKARSWLRELGAKYERENPGKDAHIVVVTHGGFLHLLTQDWDGMNPERGTGWSNTEWRAYQFKGEADEEARLVETRDSRRQRRGSEQPLTETEQMELRMAMAKGLAEEFGVDGDGQSAN